MRKFYVTYMTNRGTLKIELVDGLDKESTIKSLKDCKKVISCMEIEPMKMLTITNLDIDYFPLKS